MFPSILCCFGRVPPESDLPKTGIYTQRLARSKDVDTESRTSKNSQSSTEQTDGKSQEKQLPIVEKVAGISEDKKKENERGVEDKSQRRESYSRALDSQKTSLIPTKHNKGGGGGKPHRGKQDSRSDRDVKLPRRGSEFDSEVSSTDSHFSETRKASREANKHVSSEDTNSLSGGSWNNPSRQPQLVRTGIVSSVVMSGKFRRSLSQRDTDQRDITDHLSNQKNNTRKRNKNMKIPSTASDNSSSDTKAAAEDLNNKVVKTKSKIQKMKAPFKKLSASRFQKVPSDEETASQKTCPDSKEDTEVKKSKISRLVKFVTRGHAAASKESDRKQPSVASKEGQMDHTQGKPRTDQKPTLLSLAMTSKAWQSLSSSQSSSSSHTRPATVDLSDSSHTRPATVDLSDASHTRPATVDLSDASHTRPATVDLSDSSQISDPTSRTGRCSHATEDESTKDTDSGITSGQTTRTTTPEQRNEPVVSPSNHHSIPSIAFTNAGDQSICEEDDDLEELFINKLPNQLLGSRSSLADSRESVYSVYSDAGEGNYGRITVTGEIMFHISYNHKSNCLEVNIKQCRDLAPVDTKHDRSDPYVKTYLLPDKSRASKRKTRIRKHTLNPVFDEVLKYQINSSELDSRSLWLTVWHNDRMGRNDFLGEVTVPLDYYRLDQSAPMWYPLLERAVTQDPVMFYKGDLFIALKYISADMVEITPKKKLSSFRRKNKEKEVQEQVMGEVHVLVREAQNLTAMRGSAGSNPFCKGYILPNVAHSSKQKTPVLKKTTNPQWQHILTFEGVDQSLLHEYGLELTVWDHEKMSSNDFLGGVRLNLGQGMLHGQLADWMDAKGEEINVWQSMIEHPNEWIDAELPLRASMGKQTVKN